MNSRSRFVVLPACALALLVPVAARAAGYRGYANPIPSVGGGEANARNIEIIENLGQNVPRDLSFVDGYGKNVRVADLLGQGKPVLVTMGYFDCPLLCNLTHQGLAKGLTKAGLKLGQDFLGLAVSVNPKENPKSANTNQNRLLRSIDPSNPANNAQSNKALWPFVMEPAPASGVVVPGVAPTGRALADALGFRYFYDDESKQFAHAAAAFVLTPEGKISRYLYGVDFQPRDLRLALVEASGGRVGTTLDKVLLSCFKYDPMSKKYTPFVAGFVRIGAFLSFLALAALMGSLWWKEIQMRKQRKVPA